MVNFNKWLQYRDDYYIVCDLLIDAYLCGYNSGLADGRQGTLQFLNPEGELTELVEGEGLDPKKVLRRLTCKQQTEDPYGDCSCE